MFNTKIISLCLLLASTSLSVQGIGIPQKTSAPRTTTTKATLNSNSQNTSSSKNTQHLSSTSKGQLSSNSTSANPSTITSNDYTNTPALYWASYAAIENVFYTFSSMSALAGQMSGMDDLLDYQSSLNYTTGEIVVHSTDETMFSLYKSFYSGLPSTLKGIIDGNVDEQYTLFNSYGEYVPTTTDVPLAPETSNLYHHCLCYNIENDISSAVSVINTIDYRYQVFFETFSETGLLSSAKDFYSSYLTAGIDLPVSECLQSLNPLISVLPWASDIKETATDCVTEFATYPLAEFPLNSTLYPMTSSSYALTTTHELSLELD
ncbi:unnamed protein product [Ambrosiozyma monospora]|uniref:Unnamed protein product n=1 Tax=Ambrosiozyma monospora TaxID=43982 RepID=A0ACB5U252_AMBMO|nr:unnamed protein product [Ambrosiozyma monospora]